MLIVQSIPTLLRLRTRLFFTRTYTRHHRVLALPGDEWVLFGCEVPSPRSSFICSRIAQIFLLTAQGNHTTKNHNKKNFASGTLDTPDLESKVNHKFPGQMGSCDPNMYSRCWLTFYPNPKWIFSVSQIAPEGFPKFPIRRVAKRFKSLPRVTSEGC